MAVQQRLIKQVEGLDVIIELLDLIKDPSSIIKAHETARSQLALTEAEYLKAKEAREFLEKYDKLSADLKEKEEALIIVQNDYRLEKNNFLQDYQIKLDSLSQREILLNEKDKLQTETEKKQQEERVKLDSDIKNAEKTHNIAMKNVEEDRTINETDRQNNEAEKTRLIGIEKMWKGKIAKLKEQASDL